MAGAVGSTHTKTSADRFNISGMIQEVKAFRKVNSHSQTIGVTRILKKYIPLNSPADEVIAALGQHSMKVHKMSPRDINAAEFDDSYLIQIDLRPLITFMGMGDVLKMEVDIKAGKVAEIGGHIQRFAL
jgi:hypothetical protein